MGVLFFSFQSKKKQVKDKSVVRTLFDILVGMQDVELVLVVFSLCEECLLFGVHAIFPRLYVCI